MRERNVLRLRFKKQKERLVVYGLHEQSTEADSIYVGADLAEIETSQFHLNLTLGKIGAF
ncbi:MAG: hypothetical protein NT079_05320 [Candidatus Omnitrophica bacterium]|nr:hypothetical protein [Candidatus Omnitrophota bacterium]